MIPIALFILGLICLMMVFVLPPVSSVLNFARVGAFVCALYFFGEAALSMSELSLGMGFAGLAAFAYLLLLYGWGTEGGLIESNAAIWISFLTVLPGGTLFLILTAQVLEIFNS